MPARQSIRNRRSRRKLVRDFELPLTSMMDMLVIILVFGTSKLKNIDMTAQVAGHSEYHTEVELL